MTRGGMVVASCLSVAAALVAASVRAVGAASRLLVDPARTVPADDQITVAITALVLCAASTAATAWCSTLVRAWSHAWRSSPSAGSTPWLRTAGVVLGLTGLGLSTAAPAAADSCPTTPRFDSSRLAGLPLPSLPSAPPAAADSRSVVGDAHVVVPGDSLWRIAAARLRPAAPAADIERRWHRWYAANRALIGPDPDLIIPGQALHPPDPAPQHPRSTR